ncbi:flagellar hook assembly protein FlgD [Pelagovum sp. HNIBRBA483]|uniref:flagellar hook assembly protein FlgD n=1 Tax=Pelagovum sp. HNIBRBA483 TaxID=3233341 RepID=UPI0034A479EA
MTEISTDFSRFAPASTATDTGSAGREGGVLAQQDFLALLTAQLKNQDPLKPMDNGQFLAQMAQFSTVEGIGEMNDTLKAVGEGFWANRVSAAANLLGHSVLVPGGLARPDAEGAVHGAIDLPEGAKSVTVSYLDPMTDTVLHTERYGAQTAGQMTFSWTEVPESLVSARGQVRLSVQAETLDGTQIIPTSVYGKVTSAQGGPTSDGITLEIEDYGTIDSIEVTAFR